LTVVPLFRIFVGLGFGIEFILDFWDDLVLVVSDVSNSKLVVRYFGGLEKFRVEK